MLIWLAACAPDDVVIPEGSYVSPADGQTGVPADLPLLVQYGPLDVAPGYEGLIDVRAYDLADGGEIAGHEVIKPGRILFYPEQPWQIGHRYAWTVETRATVPHGPTTAMPATLSGTSVFEVGGDPTLLGAVLDRDERPCLLWSSPVDADLADLVIEFEGEEVPGMPVVETDGQGWRDPYVLVGGDPGLQLVCSPTIDLPADVPIRVSWDGGTWTALVEDARPAEVVEDLRRAELPEPEAP